MVKIVVTANDVARGHDLINIEQQYPEPASESYARFNKAIGGRPSYSRTAPLVGVGREVLRRVKAFEGAPEPLKKLEAAFAADPDLDWFSAMRQVPGASGPEVQSWLHEHFPHTPLLGSRAADPAKVANEVANHKRGLAAAAARQKQGVKHYALRVLGARLSLGPVLRMAAERWESAEELDKRRHPGEKPPKGPVGMTGESEPEAPEEPEAPPPPAQRDPNQHRFDPKKALVEAQWPMHIVHSGSYGADTRDAHSVAVTRGPGGNKTQYLLGHRPYHMGEDEVRQRIGLGKAAALHVAALAKRSGKVEAIHVPENGAHPWYGGQSVLVADPEGNVSHHHDRSAFIDNALPGSWPLAVANHPEYGKDFVRDNGNAGADAENQIEESRQDVTEAHNNAKQRNHLFAKLKFNHPDVAAHYLGAASHKGNIDPMLDWLAEMGHHKADDLYKLRQVSGQLHHHYPIAEAITEPPLPGQEPYRGSLQFGPALPFRPRVYRPKPRATDLKEREWGKISRYFPEPEMGPRNRRTPVRVLLNATMFRLENQIPLRELETENPDMPPWGSVHSLEARISEAQLWPTIIQQIGRTHLLDILPKMIRSAREPAGGLLGHGKQKVDISGLPAEET